jgi:dTDP-4-dehydrorhamnose reductase
MRVLLIGARGQLGSDIRRCWHGRDVTVIPADREAADVTDSAAVAALVSAARPDVVVNTAALHHLPTCEQDPARTFQVNAAGALHVARAAAAAGARSVFISTDYVFDGTAHAPYAADAARRAVNVYGASKIAAEDLVHQADSRALVVRVSGLFGLAGSAGKGGNFVETMLRLAREGKPLRVVSDQVTAPTNTADIADRLLDALRAGARGTVHLAASTSCGWYTFAAAIFARTALSPDLTAVTTSDYGDPVTRPLFSVLNPTPGLELPGWEQGLDRYLREKGHLPA